MKNFYIVLIGIVTVSIVITGVYFLGFGVQKRPTTPNINTEITPQLTPTPTEPDGPTDSQTPKTGMIEGSLSYPSEGIPENLTVCAENTQTEETFCTDDQIKDSKYAYGVGYQLEVLEGTYFVYAELSDGDYQAYYDEFVTCGLSVNCSSHEPIEVKVTAGSTKSSIDPQDWYNQ